MTLDEAIRRNPYNPKKGNEAAYCRYLRYNVDGWYQLDSKEVFRRWQKVRNHEQINTDNRYSKRMYVLSDSKNEWL